jgi:hypothetical protein
MVTVKIGPEHTKYRIHKALLEYHSDHFRSALLEHWKEGQERQVVLDDLEPAAFDIFVDWLYTNKIPRTFAEWLAPEVNENSGTTRRRLGMLHLKAYVIADRLGVPELRETINNNYVTRNILVWPWYQEIIYAFSNIPSGRRILKFLVAIHCAHSERGNEYLLEGDLELRDKLPQEFLLQVMAHYQEMRAEGTWDEELRACEYHEHASDDERKNCEGKAGKLALKKRVTWTHRDRYGDRKAKGDGLHSFHNNRVI